MRLPPPARKYSPISVMACTPETVSCPNSSSSAARSSCSRSKISFPLMRGGALKMDICFHHGDTVSRKNQTLCFLCVSVSPGWILFLVRPVIGKLQVDPEIMPPQHGDDVLQRVAVFAADPHQVSLDRGLRFLLRILN